MVLAFISQSREGNELVSSKLQQKVEKKILIMEPKIVDTKQEKNLKPRPDCGEETRHSSQCRSKASEHSWDMYFGEGHGLL